MFTHQCILILKINKPHDNQNELTSYKIIKVNIFTCQKLTNGIFMLWSYPVSYGLEITILVFLVIKTTVVRLLKYMDLIMLYGAHYTVSYIMQFID